MNDRGPARQSSRLLAARTGVRLGDSLLVVKRDRLAAQAIRIAARASCVDAEVEVVHTAREALERLQQGPVRLVVMGLTLLDIDGVDLVAQLASERRGLRVFVASGRQDERAREIARCPLVAGFFDSVSEAGEAIGPALQQVWDGGTYFSAGVVCSNVQGALGKVLSPTERQILSLIGDGTDDHAVANRLHLSVHTIHSHRQNIMRKIGVQTRSALMRVAIQRGFIRVTPTMVMRPGLDLGS